MEEVEDIQPSETGSTEIICFLLKLIDHRKAHPDACPELSMSLAKSVGALFQLETKAAGSGGERLPCLSVPNPTDLDLEDRFELQRALLPVQTAAFVEGEPTLASVSDHWKHAFDAKTLYIVFAPREKAPAETPSDDPIAVIKRPLLPWSDEPETLRPVAFVTFKQLSAGGVSVGFVAAAAVHPDFQKHGILQSVLRYFLSTTPGLAYMACRTVHPSVVATFLNVFKDQVSPFPVKPTDVVKTIGLELARVLRMSDRYTMETMIGKGVYPEFVSKSVPPIRGDRLAGLYSQLSVETGDCVILVSKIVR